MLLHTQKTKLFLEPPSSEITSESSYINRRQFLLGAGVAVSSLALPRSAFAEDIPGEKLAKPLSYKKAGAEMAGQGFYTSEAITPYKDASTYNNFYEFGTSKQDPSQFAPKLLKTDPWSIQVSGLCEFQGGIHLEDVMSRFDIEERIYRLRCVEAWSMVIPWVGLSLKSLVEYLKPYAKAKYISFVTLADKKQMPGLRSSTSLIDWPYQEALTIEEALNDLSFLAVGAYGKTILPQNGAPIRLVVPWKYGFKSIKSIVAIQFTEKQPKTSWQEIAPQEYGFYANVNPGVSHPRWSQSTERRLPSGLFSFSRRKTEMFNGYHEQVAHLYRDIDLNRYY